MEETGISEIRILGDLRKLVDAAVRQVGGVEAYVVVGHMVTRKPRSTAASTLDRMHTSVSAPVMTVTLERLRSLAMRMASARSCVSCRRHGLLS